MSQQRPFTGPPRGNDLLTHGSRSSLESRTRNFAPGNGQANGTNGNVAVGVPVPRSGSINTNEAGSRSGLEGARSPPNAKNTSHVPCKFWRQGACQAGQACPFMHADIATPCKYFQKGNCKFGMRCANEHITPDGRRINKSGLLQLTAQLNWGGRVMPTPVPPTTNSLLSMQQERFQQPNVFPMGAGSRMDFPHHVPAISYDIPTIDTTASSLPGSTPTSPQNDGLFGKFATNDLTIHDVHIPGSWDPEAYRRDKVSSSVPARFGFDSSPSSSLLNGQIAEVLTRNVSPSNIGQVEHNLNLLSLSPPANEEFYRRSIRGQVMHSERSVRRTLGLSQSYGPKSIPIRAEADDGELFAMDSMCDDSALSAIPHELGDLLTPYERRRRLSRNADDENLTNHRATLSGLGTPGGESPKIGSPHTLGASPSRFGPLFQRQARERTETGLGESSFNTFGHVGSPLRPSLLGLGSSPSLRAISTRPISTDFSMFSPPHQTSGNMTIQHLQRPQISSRTTDSDVPTVALPLQHPSLQRLASVPGAPPNRLDRTVSVASSTGLGRDKIDEEPEEGLFNMDDEDGNKWKRRSGPGGSLGANREASDKDKLKGLGVIGGGRSNRSSGGSS